MNILPMLHRDFVLILGLLDLDLLGEILRQEIIQPHIQISRIGTKHTLPSAHWAGVLFRPLKFDKTAHTEYVVAGETYRFD